MVSYIKTHTHTFFQLFRFQRVQTHALLCLNNLVSALDIEALGGVPKLHSIWQGLTQLATAVSSEYNVKHEF